MTQDASETKEPKEDIRVTYARIRTALANRRTFLAWCRTALGLMAFGFVLEKLVWFLKAEHMAQHVRTLHEFGFLGTASFFMGGLLIVVSGWRYLRIERQLGDARIRDMLPEVLLAGTIIVVMLVAVLFSENLFE